MGTWEERMAPRSQPQPQLQRVRTIWIMTRPPNKSLTAAVYDVETGRELRVYYGQDEFNVVDSLLSRTGEQALLQRASELRQILEWAGWAAASKCIDP